jgi:hypothetical protein
MNPTIKIDKLSFVLFAALLILALLIFIPTFFSTEKRTTNTSAREGWRCPGPNCDKCGCSGFWGDQCSEFCSQNPGSGQCGCKNPQELPTSTPIPTSPSSNPSPTTQPDVNIILTPTISGTQSDLTNTTSPNNSTDYFGAFISFLFGNTTQSSNGAITPTISPTTDPNNYPTITLPPIVTNAPIQDISAVIAFVENVQKYCGGRIDYSNVSCLNNFYIQPNAKYYFVASVEIRGIEECAMAVKGWEAMTNGVLIGEVDNAIRFFTDRKPPQYERHYKSEGGIQIGDLAFWNNDTYGHTAKVIGVNPQNKTFTVAEANWDGKGGVRTSEKRLEGGLDSEKLMGWLRYRKQ